MIHLQLMQGMIVMATVLQMHDGDGVCDEFEVAGTCTEMLQ